eukprot:TRINITY_DN5809_c0_g1_i1.p1 TRINITY_DN5809_c0_g1~~TRINITY_DN5809_c0_g1_i1.p1  ORF type:complete len:1767 (+),score=119.70 TRINITY_DN5809_c0_g1_i1:82-5301(+)
MDAQGDPAVPHAEHKEELQSVLTSNPCPAPPAGELAFTFEKGELPESPVPRDRVIAVSEKINSFLTGFSIEERELILEPFVGNPYGKSKSVVNVSAQRSERISESREFLVKFLASFTEVESARALARAGCFTKQDTDFLKTRQRFRHRAVRVAAHAIAAVSGYHAHSSSCSTIGSRSTSACTTPLPSRPASRPVSAHTTRSVGRCVNRDVEGLNNALERSLSFASNTSSPRAAVQTDSACDSLTMALYPGKGVGIDAERSAVGDDSDSPPFVVGPSVKSAKMVAEQHETVKKSSSRVNHLALCDTGAGVWSCDEIRDGLDDMQSVAMDPIQQDESHKIQEPQLEPSRSLGYTRPSRIVEEVVVRVKQGRDIDSSSLEGDEIEDRSNTVALAGSLSHAVEFVPQQSAEYTSGESRHCSQTCSVSGIAGNVGVAQRQDVDTHSSSRESPGVRLTIVDDVFSTEAMLPSPRSDQPSSAQVSITKTAVSALVSDIDALQSDDGILTSVGGRFCARSYHSEQDATNFGSPAPQMEDAEPFTSFKCDSARVERSREFCIGADPVSFPRADLNTETKRREVKRVSWHEPSIESHMSQDSLGASGSQGDDHIGGSHQCHEALTQDLTSSTSLPEEDAKSDIRVQVLDTMAESSRESRFEAVTDACNDLINKLSAMADPSQKPQNGIKRDSCRCDEAMSSLGERDAVTYSPVTSDGVDEPSSLAKSSHSVFDKSDRASRIRPSDDDEGSNEPHLKRKSEAHAPIDDAFALQECSVSTDPLMTSVGEDEPSCFLKTIHSVPDESSNPNSLQPSDDDEGPKEHHSHPGSEAHTEDGRVETCAQRVIADTSLQTEGLSICMVGQGGSEDCPRQSSSLLIGSSSFAAEETREADEVARQEVVVEKDLEKPMHASVAESTQRASRVLDVESELVPGSDVTSWRSDDARARLAQCEIKMDVSQESQETSVSKSIRNDNANASANDLDSSPDDHGQRGDDAIVLAAEKGEANEDESQDHAMITNCVSAVHANHAAGELMFDCKVDSDVRDSENCSGQKKLEYALDNDSLSSPRNDTNMMKGEGCREEKLQDLQEVFIVHDHAPVDISVSAIQQHDVLDPELERVGTMRQAMIGSTDTPDDNSRNDARVHVFGATTEPSGPPCKDDVRRESQHVDHAMCLRECVPVPYPLRTSVGEDEPSCAVQPTHSVLDESINPNRFQPSDDYKGPKGQHSHPGSEAQTEYGRADACAQRVTADICLQTEALGICMVGQRGSEHCPQQSSSLPLGSSSFVAEQTCEADEVARQGQELFPNACSAVFVDKARLETMPIDHTESAHSCSRRAHAASSSSPYHENAMHMHCQKTTDINSFGVMTSRSPPHRRSIPFRAEPEAEPVGSFIDARAKAEACYSRASSRQRSSSRRRSGSRQRTSSSARHQRSRSASRAVSIDSCSEAAALVASNHFVSHLWDTREGVSRGPSRSASRHSCKSGASEVSIESDAAIVAADHIIARLRPASRHTSRFTATSSETLSFKFPADDCMDSGWSANRCDYSPRGGASGSRVGFHAMSGSSNTAGAGWRANTMGYNMRGEVESRAHFNVPGSPRSTGCSHWIANSGHYSARERGHGSRSSVYSSSAGVGDFSKIQALRARQYRVFPSSPDVSHHARSSGQQSIPSSPCVQNHAGRLSLSDMVSIIRIFRRYDVGDGTVTRDIMLDLLPKLIPSVSNSRLKELLDHWGNDFVDYNRFVYHLAARAPPS